jgi:hypothetical protein
MLIALFRSRTATEENKGSALVTLAGILEGRQLDDYGRAFLDWICWWYLGTVDLTNRIIDRQASQGT